MAAKKQVEEVVEDIQVDGPEFVEQPYRYTITGETELLMAADDIEAADAHKAWVKDAEVNAKYKIEKGDDRTPPWTWMIRLYWDRETSRIALPTDNIGAALRKAASRIQKKGQATFKEESQTAFYFETEYAEMRLANGKPAPKMADIEKMRDNLSFAEHRKFVEKQGFDLHMKRLPLTKGGTKHVRIRPLFEPGWTLTGTLIVTNPIVTHDILKQMFRIAGTACGLGDFRPSAPKTPGRYGQFSTVIEPI